MTDRFHRWLIFGCYFFGLLLSGAVLCTEKENPRIYFHALQAFLFHVCLSVVYIPLGCAGVWVLMRGHKAEGYVLMGIGALFLAAMAIAWIALLVQALSGGDPRIPWFTARLSSRQPRFETGC